MNEKYKVIDEKIFPTIDSSGNLAVVYLKVLKEVKESGAAGAFSTSFSSPTSASNNSKIATITHFASGKTRTEPLAILNGDMTEAAINAHVESLTEGMSEANKLKITEAILGTNGIIPEGSHVTDYSFNEAEIKTLVEVATKIGDDLEKMKNGSVGTASNSKLEHYSFRKHLLIQGEKGGGKTYMVDKLIKEKKYSTEFIGGHEAIEAIDFLGHYIKTDSGSLVWKDGGLSSAFRKAMAGEKIVLFIDEMLRIPKRELNILVAALTPDSDGKFNLRTNRAVDITVDSDGSGIANEEVLTVESNMLWAIGTTNAGAGYAVDTIDEALADRFRTIIKTVDEKEIKAILSGYVKDKGYSKKVVPSLVKFYKLFHDMKKSGELTKVLNVRHLVEAITLSDDESQIKEMLADLIPTIVTMDVHGHPNESQSAVVEVIIEKSGV